MSFFSKIDSFFYEQNKQQLRQQDDYGSYSDFSKKEDLVKVTKQYFDDYLCPRCGSKRTKGHGIQIRYGKVEFYREVSCKGFFGGTKYKDELYKTVWRIHEIGLKPGQKSGLLDSGIAPGRIFCEAKGCDWKMEAPTYPKKSKITWYSVNDLKNGIPFKKD